LLQNTILPANNRIRKGGCCGGGGGWGCRAWGDYLVDKLMWVFVEICVKAIEEIIFMVLLLCDII
jgi:hypothetical protein